MGAICRHDQVPELDGHTSPAAVYEIVVNSIFAAETVAALLERCEIFIRLRDTQHQKVICR